MANRILVVEDERNTRRALVALFAKLGLIPLEAANATEAIERLNRETDIICLDLMLPDRSGVEVLQYVRQQKLSAKVAVISGANEPSLLAQVTALRPDAIFGKPLDLEDFLDWLNSVGIQTGRKLRPETLRRASA
jgi:two-component system, NarL family, response regulator DesR